ncbi:hypothetical protein FBZ93_103467 [Bradyrhizobium macuxiense]|uniref:Uncharacterized protein n=1 Tax=Bradyrhizobium macuxiense TaxID=1755647 RepID=A0A560MCW7_9BRAD|nr:hypothetical protein FBZ93_103467 [Bradyrhizobium macuxiense]
MTPRERHDMPWIIAVAVSAFALAIVAGGLTYLH